MFMKKFLFVLCMLSSSLIIAQSQFNLKGGINYTQQGNRFFEDGEVSGGEGFQIGAEYRFGDRLYISPGIYYFEYTSDIDFVEGANLNPIQLQFQGLRIPIFLGGDLIKGENFGIRAYGGPNLSFLINDEDGINSFFDDDPIREVLWGINAGVGIDLGIITFDITHEWRAEDVLKTDDVKFRNNILYFQVGILF